MRILVLTPEGLARESTPPECALSRTLPEYSTMKTCLEFGVRGGQLEESIVLPSIKLGMRLAASIMRTYKNESVSPTYFALNKHDVRITWQSDTHFVSLSMLDGIPRG